jgi:hypothetical protein
VNDPDNLNDPNRWQPVRNTDGSVQTFLAPHWGLVTPFALNSSSEARPEPPPMYHHGLYRRDANQVPVGFGVYVMRPFSRARTIGRA